MWCSLGCRPMASSKFFLMTQFVAGQTDPDYKASTRYLDEGGKWTAETLPEPLQRVLDAASDGKHDRRGDS